ncbi:uncharacterized protein [Prorops nasuta]|uniref:uncharacterized protein n=1 Tax=Prorops nasuta TaxID=863751 RepID=UPI0034CDF8B9
MTNCELYRTSIWSCQRRVIFLPHHMSHSPYIIQALQPEPRAPSFELRSTPNFEVPTAPKRRTKHSTLHSTQDKSPVKEPRRSYLCQIRGSLWFVGDTKDELKQFETE